MRKEDNKYNKESGGSSKIIRISLIIFFCSLLVIFVIWRLGFFTRPTKVQNFILLSVDDLRADRLGCYGNDRDVSPFIDKLANEGAQFLNAYICWPFTPRSHASMLTSVYPSVFDIPVDSNIESVASILSEHGYKTGALTEDGWMSARYGVLHGFEEYDDKVKGLIDLKKKTKKWLGKNREEKFFLFLHTYRIHRPFVGPQEYFLKYADPDYSGPIENNPRSIGSFMKAANAGAVTVTPEDRQRILAIYDSQIIRVDEFVSEIVETLTALDILNKTMLIITSDHGEQLYEFKKFGHLSRANPFADVTTRVPLVIYSPRLPNKGKIARLVEVIDIPPTILDAVGLKSPKTFQGKSLFPVLSGKSRFFQKKKTEVFFRTFRFVGMRAENMKLTVNLETGDTKLIDLVHDPAEKRNIIEEFPTSKLNPLMKKIKMFEDKNEALREKLGISKIQMAQDLLSNPASFDRNSVFLAAFDDNTYVYREKNSKQVSHFEAEKFQFGEGRFGQSLSLEPEKKLNFPVETPLLIDSGSIEFWIKINSEVPDNQKFLNIDLAGKEDSISIQAGLAGDFGERERKRVSFELKRLRQENMEKDIHFATAFSLNTWHHVLISWEPEDVFLLVDGVLVAREMIYPASFFEQEFTDSLRVSGDNCLFDEFRISDWSRLHQPRQKRKKKLDPELIKKLRALGYIN